MRQRGKVFLDQTDHRWKYGACALHTGYLRLQIHIQNMQYLLLCQGSGYKNSPHCYVIRTLYSYVLLTLERKRCRFSVKPTPFYATSRDVCVTAPVCIIMCWSWDLVGKHRKRNLNSVFWGDKTYIFRRSQRPRHLRHRSAAASLLGLQVRIPPAVCLSVSCECCVFSGRRFCDGLIARPEEPYRERARVCVCVFVCVCVIEVW
jgi:hypothetical protein